MGNFTIAIIDSGIDCIEKYNGISVHLNETTGTYEIQNDFADQNGHGTIVANIIESHVKNVNLFIVKIFGDEEEIESEKLIFALNYLLQEIHPQLIHLSMGISFCDQISELKNVCDNLVANGTIIVSAFDNDGSLSYPAAFQNVIGVESSSNIRKTTDYIYWNNSPINISAIGIAQRLKGKYDKYYDVIGSSFAAPYITSIIANMMERENIICIDDILQKLKANAYKIYSPEKTSIIEKPFDIKKAIVFPYNKEISTLIRFRQYLVFDLLGIYDLKFLNNIGKEILLDNKCIKIESFEKIPWDEDFDTVILGHMNELNSISNRDYTKKIVNYCIKYHKNLYSFDLLNLDYQEQMRKVGLKVFTPKISIENVPYNQNGKLRQIGKPILCIAGTSSKQGKFSLQIQLMNLMKKKNNVGMLSTEPSGYLLGADVVFPVGYSSSISFENGEQYIAAINYAMGEIEDKEVDIIITGLQSQTIPMKLCNLRDMVISNHYCLLGVNPDAVILMVNVFDEFDYIKRTISYLENIIMCDVISVVVFPIMRTFKWNTLGDLSVRYEESELIDFKKRLSSFINIPVYILDDENDINNLSYLCYEYFSEY